MINNQNPKDNKFDLEDRTTNFAKRVIRLCKELSNSSINYPLINQIIRSSGSVGANYREANDALGKKDFIHRLRISRKETKETIHWLELIEEANLEFKPRMQNIKQEAREIKNILSTIIINSNNKNKTNDYFGYISTSRQTGWNLGFVCVLVSLCLVSLFL